MSERQAHTLDQTPQHPAEELTPRFRRKLGGAVRMRFVPGAIRDIGAAGDIPEAHMAWAVGGIVVTATETATSATVRLFMRGRPPGLCRG